MPIVTRPVVALPGIEVTLDELVAHLRSRYAHVPELPRALSVIRACGVKTRRYCRPLDALDRASLGQRMRWHFGDVCDLSESAARQALAVAGIEAGDVGTLIVNSVAAYQMPTPDLVLIDRLGLPATVRRISGLNLGCGGAPAALTLATQQATLYPDRPVLVVCADMLMPFIHPDDTGLDTMIFRGLIGEGAAACLVHGGDAGEHGPTIIDSWTYTQPGASSIVGYRLDDDGFHPFNSPRILTTMKALVPRLAAWLGDKPEFVVAHPGSSGVLKILADGFGGDPAVLDNARQSLAERGNMGSPSMMDVLVRTFDDPPPPGSRGVLTGPAPGVSLIATLAEWH